MFEIALTLSGVKANETTLYKDRVACFGSGKAKAEELLEPGTKTNDIIRVLAQVIEDAAVPSVGGVPQMVTIQRRGSRAVGFNWDVKHVLESTLFGLPLHFRSDLRKVKFRDRRYRITQYLHDPRLRHMTYTRGGKRATK